MAIFDDAMMTTPPSQLSSLTAGGILVAAYKQEARPVKRSVFIDDNLLLFVLQGYKRLHYHQQVITVEPGSLLLIKRGLYMMAELVDEGLDYRALVINCNRYFLQDWSLKHQPPSKLPIQAVDYVSITSSSLLDSYVQHFLAYFDKPNLAGLDQILHLKLQELFLLLTAGSHRAQVMNWIQYVVSQESFGIEQVVNTYLFQPFSIDELAKLCEKSIASFKREFHAQYGTSPRKWINAQRVTHAQSLLSVTTQSVNEIALACGFENVPYFIRLFKQTIGQPPQQWRKEQQIERSV